MDEFRLRYERIRGDGITLNVGRAGSGPPVILLHGFPLSGRSWRHQVGPLVRAGYSVWVPDLRGYAHSDRPAGLGAYHIRHLAGDVAALVRATGAARATVVGHDWGGAIAWAWAGAYPEMVDRLVIMNAPHLALWAKAVRRPRQFLRSQYALFFQLPYLPEWVLSARDFALIRAGNGLLHARRETYLSDDADDYVNALRPQGALTAALNYYRALRLPGVREAGAQPTQAETLVIWGERDPSLGLEVLDGLTRVAPHARVHRIPDAGHTVQMEAPNEVNRALLGFLRSGHESGDPAVMSARKRQ